MLIKLNYSYHTTCTCTCTLHLWVAFVHCIVVKLSLDTRIRVYQDFICEFVLVNYSQCKITFQKCKNNTLRAYIFDRVCKIYTVHEILMFQSCTLYTVYVLVHNEIDMHVQYDYEYKQWRRVS